MGRVTRARRIDPDPADAPAFRAARNACRRHAGGLYFASAFLPAAKRDAAHAAYAFCRMIRDAIEAGGGDPASGPTGDRLRHTPLAALPRSAVAGVPAGVSGGCCSPHPLDQHLALLRDRLNDLYEGRLELPSVAGRSDEHHALHAFAAAARRYQIPRHYFLDFAQGCRDDLAVSRYATWTSLERHLQRCGGAAGLIAGGVFGVTHSGASEYAVKAGKVMRLTAILQNLRADAAQGRVYLPLEDLAAYRYSERELSAGVVNENFRRLMAFQVDRARRLFAEAAEGLCWVAGDGSRLTAATVLVWGAKVLDAIERQGYDVFSRQPAPGAAARLRALPLAWRLARRGPDAPVPAFAAARGGPVLASGH